MPYRVCYPIFKLIYFAVANAKHNMGLNEEYLVIIKATTNEGTTMKKPSKKHQYSFMNQTFSTKFLISISKQFHIKTK